MEKFILGMTSSPIARRRASSFWNFSMLHVPFTASSGWLGRRTLSATSMMSMFAPDFPRASVSERHTVSSVRR